MQRRLAWIRLAVLFLLAATLHGRSHAVAQFRSRLLRVDGSVLETRVQMRFVPDTDTIDPKSHTLLDLMVTVLVRYPEIEQLRILMLRAARPELARRRSHAVSRALVERGIPADSLRILASGAPPKLDGQPPGGTFLLYIQRSKTSSKYRDCRENGRTFPHGAHWTCADGCNHCACENGEISSTMMGCL